MDTDPPPPSFRKDAIAVALEYDQEKDNAPRVSASGKGMIAEQIIALAKAHNITVHKDKDLAKVLSVLELNTVIPVEAYAAVAEIISYIYKTNAAKRP